MRPKHRLRPNRKKSRDQQQAQPAQKTLPRLPEPAEGANGEIRIEEREGGVSFDVHVVPRSAKNRVAGIHGNRLHVKVNAPPVEGAANRAVCMIIAKALGVPPGQVSIIQGVSGRLKRVRVEGVSEPEARKAFVF
ncbi:MAG: DUF167 domain-containing protein [Myxococcota bacterium]